MTSGTTDAVTCSFCGLSEKEARAIVASPRATICEECLKLGLELVEGREEQDETVSRAPPSAHPPPSLDDLERRAPQLAKFQCTFCDKHRLHVRTLMAGPGGVYICDGCIRIALDACAGS